MPVNIWCCLSTGTRGKTHLCRLLWQPCPSHQEWPASSLQLLCFQREQTGTVHQSEHVSTSLLSCIRIHYCFNRLTFMHLQWKLCYISLFFNWIQYVDRLISWLMCAWWCHRSEITLRSRVVACPLWRSHGLIEAWPTTPYATSTSHYHHTLR